MNVNYVIAPVLGAWIGCAGVAGAAPTKHLVEEVTRAIAGMDSRERSQWAYRRTIRTRDKVMVSRYDPRLDATTHGWRLEQVNGAEPTPDEMAEFAEQVNKAQARLESDPGSDPGRIDSLVRLDSLRLTSTNDAGQATFAFTPTIPNSPADQPELWQAELVFDSAAHRVQSISVRNLEAYSPRFPVTIRVFEMHMSFEPVAGQVLVTGITTRIQGKVLIKKIDEDLRVTFADYEWTGD